MAEKVDPREVARNPSSRSGLPLSIPVLIPNRIAIPKHLAYTRPYTKDWQQNLENAQRAQSPQAYAGVASEYTIMTRNLTWEDFRSLLQESSIPETGSFVKMGEGRRSWISPEGASSQKALSLPSRCEAIVCRPWSEEEGAVYGSGQTI